MGGSSGRRELAVVAAVGGYADARGGQGGVVGVGRGDPVDGPAAREVVVAAGVVFVADRAGREVGRTAGRFAHGQGFGGLRRGPALREVVGEAAGPVSGAGGEWGAADRVFARPWWPVVGEGEGCPVWVHDFAGGG